MIIDKVTITGIDNNTSIKELEKAQNEFPFVEWGVLIASNPGRDRQPTEEYILELQNRELNLALHICSQHTKDIFNGIINVKYDFFNRYQLNFNFKYTDHDLCNYTKLVNKYKNKFFILQSNLSNKSYINEIIAVNDTVNTNILYDSSGGRGIQIVNIESPYKNIYTGYSGAISPDNIKDVCKMISKHDNDSKVWIDMETAVRTNNILDFEKIYKVLKAVDKIIN